MTGASRLIRRYDNRKLYDVAARRYVTLDELQGFVSAGEEVTVLDQKTGDDLTSLTLAQIILEGLRQRTVLIPRSVLVQLVRLQSLPGSGKHWPSPQEAAQRTREEAEKIVGGLLARGRLSLEEGITLRRDIVHSVGHLVSEAQAGLESGLQRLFGGETAPPPKARTRRGPPPRPKTVPRTRGRRTRRKEART
ncbi:MAG TPA: polyhydroxyalkanoate synthesis regulator DNA-binding domain-containing protein [Vicinamibacteria bacterium]|nr:polyhydroxyalkanoate synthesis regulator DNA-binding domain-containing protein [Vicinamibacteria bacterium]